MTTTEIEEIRKLLNDLQLICDDSRIPKGMTNKIMKVQRAIKAKLDEIEPVDGDEEYTIALKWSVGDVQSVCPGLDDAQAAEVLDFVDRNHDATLGVNWDTLTAAADELFPDRDDDEDEEGDDDEEEEDDDES
jgi:hypothetical protein